MAALIRVQEEHSPWLTVWPRLLAENGGRAAMACVRDVLPCRP